MNASHLNFQNRILRSLASGSNIDECRILLIDLLKEHHVSNFKLSWLDDLRNEKPWFECDYAYSFETKKIFISLDNREIAVLYYNASRDIYSIENYISSIVIHCFLIDVYREKSVSDYYSKDMSLASKMQQMLVPKNLFCNLSFCASGLYIPNNQVGGDFYDVIPINDYKIGFCIGDISGKGINAAIIMSYFMSFIRSTLLQNLKLEDTVNIINEKMYELTLGEKYITLFLGVYNTEDKRLIYINSGHLPIPIYNKNHIEWLETGTTILGMFKEIPFMELGKVFIDSKKQLLLYTDGLLNLNIDHEPFLSNKELAYLLNKDCIGKSTKDVIDYFNQLVKRIDVSEELKDDISLLAIDLG